MLETHTYKEVETMTGITKRILIRGKNEQEARVKDWFSSGFLCGVHILILQIKGVRYIKGDRI
ncbi:hypothetical protein [Bacillus toyonensis]|uniref:hypothetical protein n=1 Tax=Bacillus toyonensis TaxID=155322 RepID=UPI001F0B6B5D|nr:hypothetical protein [Bacillus toyonensis]